MSSDPAITVLMAGLPGAMGVAVSEACLRRGFALAPFGLAGPGRSGEVEVGGQSVTLLPAHGDAAAAAIAELQRACAAAAPTGPRTIVVVDYTHPSAVNANGELYAKHGLPFVMGTTGGDREALLAATAAGAGSGYAVVAANMCKQIVALQATMAHMAATFPGAFGGYELSIVESHQSTKADTSGTAKDMICHFNGLTGGGGGGVAAGLEAFGVDDVRKLREAEAQLAFGVPEAALAGHAYHTYSLTSGAGDVRFEFKHNVQGRTTYAEGTADAVQFLAAKVAAAAGAGGAAAAGEQKIFNMIDILQAGAMS